MIYVLKFMVAIGQADELMKKEDVSVGIAPRGLTSWGVSRNSHSRREEDEADTEKQGTPDIPLNV
jgi:hypothetical protein